MNRKTLHDELTADDLDIIDTLEKINESVDATFNALSHVTEPLLMDSYIYELMALRLRYRFYLQMCKDRGLIARIPINENAAILERDPFILEKDLVAPTEQIWNRR